MGHPNTEPIEGLLWKLATEAPKRYSHMELQSFTSNFSREVGSGSYGRVYKGEFSNGVKIAVKVLLDDGFVAETFEAEVSTIGMTSHRYLVKLYGFCFDENMKALVYEHMENGSLDKILYENQLGMDWERFYRIAIETAKGLSYLHDGCVKQIIHHDIKAANILLDSNYGPKVTDFGLAKLMNREDTHRTNTGMRGTMNYAAPEVCYPSFPITYKCDVYSFGMLLFEILGMRNNGPRENWFPKQVWKKFEIGQLDDIITDCGIPEKSRENAKTLSMVAFLCAQWTPTRRPSMSTVVKMLEKEIPITTLPYPFYPSSESSMPPIQKLEDSNVYPSISGERSSPEYSVPPMQEAVHSKVSPSIYSKSLHETISQHKETMLENFEENCPPGGENTVIFYSNRKGSYRAGSSELRSILLYHGVHFVERKVEDCPRSERVLLHDLLGSQRAPALFVKGRSIGGVDEVLKLEEEGKMSTLFDEANIPKGPKEFFKYARSPDSLLELFEKMCPYKGHKLVTLYTESGTELRPLTEYNCKEVVSILKLHQVKFVQKDVSNLRYKMRLRGILKDVDVDERDVPILFVKGRYIGHAHELKKMEKEGTLSILFDDETLRLNEWSTEFPLTFLKLFEKYRRPGGDENTVLITSRCDEYYEKSGEVRSILQYHGVNFVEVRLDHGEFTAEGVERYAPALFVKGRFIGGVDEVLMMEKEGKISILFDEENIQRGPKVLLRDERDPYSLLESFDQGCPPGGKNSVSLYTDYSITNRMSYDNSKELVSILKSHEVKFVERDFGKDWNCKNELIGLGHRVRTPALFVKGRYIGRAHEVKRMDKEGTLSILFDNETFQKEGGLLFRSIITSMPPFISENTERLCLLEKISQQKEGTSINKEFSSNVVFQPPEKSNNILLDASAPDHNVSNDNSKELVSILKSHEVKFVESFVKDWNYKNELIGLGHPVWTPALFVEGRYIGRVHEVKRMDKEGTLSILFDNETFHEERSPQKEGTFSNTIYSDTLMDSLETDGTSSNAIYSYTLMDSLETEGTSSNTIYSDTLIDSLETGLLFIHFLGAKDVEMYNNLYASIHFRGEHRKTRTITEMPDTYWKEESPFLLVEAPNKNDKIHIKIMSNPPAFRFTGKECVGSIDFDLVDVVKYGCINQEYLLSDSRNGGKIHVAIEWKTTATHWHFLKARSQCVAIEWKISPLLHFAIFFALCVFVRRISSPFDVQFFVRRISSPFDVQFFKFPFWRLRISSPFDVQFFKFPFWRFSTPSYVCLCTEN